MRIIFWVIIFIIIAAGGYFFIETFNALPDSNMVKEGGNKTNSENSEWQEYKNEQYGFSIKYPAEWEVQEALKPQEIRALHEIVFFEKEYEIHRASLTVRIFTNDEEQTINEWWNAWLSDEDKKKEECIAEYGEGNTPCLFLRDLIEREEEVVLAGVSAHKVGLFRFDSEEECIYASRGKYIYGICYDGQNPNDPDFEANKEITKKMRESFSFEEIAASTTERIAKQLVGSWQSEDDAKSVMFFEEDGTLENIYDGETIGTGTWEVVDSLPNIGESPTGAFLRTVVMGEEYLYTVVSLSEENLELTYLARGNTLKFIRK